SRPESGIVRFTMSALHIWPIIEPIESDGPDVSCADGSLVAVLELLLPRLERELPDLQAFCSSFQLVESGGHVLVTLSQGLVSVCDDLEVRPQALGNDIEMTARVHGLRANEGL